VPGLVRRSIVHEKLTALLELEAAVRVFNQSFFTDAEKRRISMTIR
jgi:hypothetical protein